MIGIDIEAKVLNLLIFSLVSPFQEWTTAILFAKV